MTFVQNLSQINKFVSLFGIAPYFFNEKSKKFECSVLTLVYTFIYFLCISIGIIYMAFAYYLKDDQMFQSTYKILTLLQQATVMTIFYAIMLDLMLKRQKHANLLNSLVTLDSDLRKFYTKKNYESHLLTMHKQIVFVVCFYASVYVLNSIINRDQMAQFEHLWNVLQLFQTISITLVAYYVRCFAVILNDRCQPISERLDSIANDLRHSGKDNQKHIIPEVMDCFQVFDDVMNLKNQLSNQFGIQLLLNSAFDFIILTISVYGLLYFQTKNLIFLYYVTAYNIPHVYKCVALVLALDKLANQITTLRAYALKVPVYPNSKLSELMDLVFLKITHMEKDKYVTANDFYPINRSMLYGMGAAIVTHMLIIFQFQQWEDSQPSMKQHNDSQHFAA